jgi:hypothetical protein
MNIDLRAYGAMMRLTEDAMVRDLITWRDSG